MNSISRNFACGAKSCIFIVAAFCIVVVLPPPASGDTVTAQLQAAAEKGYVSQQIDLATANSIGKRGCRGSQDVYSHSEQAKRFAASARIAVVDDSHAGQPVPPPPA